MQNLDPDDSICCVPNFLFPDCSTCKYGSPFYLAGYDCIFYDCFYEPFLAYLEAIGQDCH